MNFSQKEKFGDLFTVVSAVLAGLALITGFVASILNSNVSKHRAEQLASLDTVSKKLQVKILETEDSLAQTEIVLEKEKTRRINLERSFSWRRINTTSFSESIRNFKDITYNLDMIGNDPEIQSLHSQLFEAFRMAGWKQGDVMLTGLQANIREIPTGLIIRAMAEDEYDKMVISKITEELKKFNIVSRLESPSEAMPLHVLSFTVCPRPLYVPEKE